MQLPQRRRFEVKEVWFGQVEGDAFANGVAAERMNRIEGQFVVEEGVRPQCAGLVSCTSHRVLVVLDPREITPMHRRESPAGAATIALAVKRDNAAPLALVIHLASHSAMLELERVLFGEKPDREPTAVRYAECGTDAMACAATVSVETQTLTGNASTKETAMQTEDWLGSERDMMTRIASCSSGMLHELVGIYMRDPQWMQLVHDIRGSLENAEPLPLKVKFVLK